ncbi:MAG TPA: PP2C family protein-serine/threonine phosphatase [Thermoanaerobaculia bacterium]|nr:PP2C family protein-serine/threonine phosphatase [Thermoanaerobaculia bacterium]
MTGGLRAREAFLVGVASTAALLAPELAAQSEPGTAVSYSMGPFTHFFIGVATAFAFLHLMIFMYQRKERGNLHLAVAAASFAVASYYDDGIVPMTAIMIMILAFIRFAYWFTYDRPPRRSLWIWLGAAALTWVVIVITDSLLAFWAFVAVSLIELVRAMLRGPTRRQPGDWIVAAGFAAIFLTAAAQGVFDVSAALREQPSDTPIYPYGMLALFVAMSIYLSLRFGTAQRDLEARLREVEALSARSLEQEREAREREVERRLLEADNARKTGELDAARRLQLSLLPATLPDLPDVDVAFAMRTATEVGGDYYDYRTENGALTLGIGDATGHGADAGILVATVKGLFHTTRLEHGLRPALDRVSEGVAGLGLKRHHMSLALLRYSGGAVRFAAAGMPPLLVHRVSTGEVEEILLEAPPLGVVYDRPYPEVRSRVEPGDTLLLTTDGLAERRNDRDELFGYERLRSAFASCVRLDASAIADHLFEASDDWAGGAAQDDDMTAVVLRVRSVDHLPSTPPTAATGV